VIDEPGGGSRDLNHFVEIQEPAMVDPPILAVTFDADH
jgi:hypothetical protein